MLILINSLIGVLITLTLLVCLVFKSTFAYFMAFTILSISLIATRADVHNKLYKTSTVLNLIWLILCEIIAFAFNFICHINVFEKFGNNTFNFVMMGLFVLLVPYFIRLFIPKFNNTKSN